MTTSGGFVSVVLPVRNGARYLGEALASVLGQDPPPGEVLVADDGSTDATAEVARAAGSRVRVLTGPFGGAAASRNAGVAAARGDLLAFLDHDDLWLPGRLARHLDLLRCEPAIDLVLGQTQRVREEGGALVPLAPPLPEPSFGAVLLTRRGFDRVGALDVARTFDEDVDWFLRAREADLAVRLDPHVVQLYRRHETNATNQRAANVRGFFGALRDSIARRRGPDGVVRPLGWWSLATPPEGPAPRGPFDAEASAP